MPSQSVNTVSKESIKFVNSSLLNDVKPTATIFFLLNPIDLEHFELLAIIHTVLASRIKHKMRRKLHDFRKVCW